MPKRYVLTGAPGAGKTELAAGLQALGYGVVPEAATDVIAVEQSRGVDEPWQRKDFTGKIVALQKQRQLEADESNGPVQVYDRSPLCTLALARYLGHPVTPLLAAEVDRVVDQRVYELEVFLVRPLGFIRPTAARRISYEDSLEFEAVHKTTYLEYGFRLVDVPADTVEARAATVNRIITTGHHDGG